MIKKLRKKLVLASMVSLLVVLLIIEGSIGILNYPEKSLQTQIRY